MPWNQIYTWFPMVIILFFTIFILITNQLWSSWTFNWDCIRPELRDSIKMSTTGFISSSSYGNGERRMRELDRREWIIKEALVHELKCLTEFENGNVKAIAYEGLIRRNGLANKTEMALKAVNDTAYKIHVSGWTREISIGEYIVYCVLKLGDQPPLGENHKTAIVHMDSIDELRILNEVEKRKGRY